MIFFIPLLHSTPPLWGSPSEYCHPVWYGKTRMVGPHNDEKIHDMFMPFRQNTGVSQKDKQHSPHLCRASVRELVISLSFSRQIKFGKFAVFNVLFNIVPFQFTLNDVI